MTVLSVLRRARRKAAGWVGAVPPGARFAPRRDDVMLVSYPRSGNTWMRFLLGNLVIGQEITFRNIEDAVPDIYVTSERRLKGMPSPRVIKSHEPCTLKYPRVIYLVRDPRDVAISYFHFKRKVGGERFRMTWETYLSHFLEGNLDRFGSWGGHVQGWLDRAASSDRLTVVAYEELRRDPVEILARVADFAGLECSSETIDQAVDQGHIENMQKQENDTGQQWRPLQSTDPGIRFVRRGEPGGWVDTLSDTDARRIAECWPETFVRCGYV